ncbi:MAG: hypothetical protein FWD27_01575 [Coriobacteriia bacterium]|nr:hypothetical protein [Coriobacteriia bacterium]
MNTALKRVRSLFFILLLCTSLVGVTACGETQLEEPVEPAEAELRILGDAGSDDAIIVEITNATGLDIIAFAIKRSTDEGYGESLVTKSTMIGADETVMLHLAPPPETQVQVTAATNNEEDAEDSQEATGITDDDGAEGGIDAVGLLAENAAEDAGGDAADGAAIDLVMRCLYNIALTFDNDSSAILHNLNLEDLASMEVHLASDGVPFIKYVDVDDTSGSTLETERAFIQAEAEAAEEAALAQAEAEAAAEAEAQAQAEAEAEAAAAAEAAQQYSGGFFYDTGGGGAAASQNPNVCVDDLVLR